MTSHKPRLSLDRKIIIIFHLVLLFLLGVMAFTYSHNLMVFATQEVKFLRLTEYLHPDAKLAETFACSDLSAYQLCGSEYYFLWGMIVLIELFTLAFILKNFKKVPLSRQLRFAALMQLSLLATLVVYWYTPTVVTSQLSTRAKAEIASAQQILLDPKLLHDRNILSDTTQIASEVAKMPLDNFTIVERNAQAEAFFQLLEVYKNQQTSFYKAIVVPYEVMQGEYEKVQISSLFFPTGTLVVQKITKEDLAALTPTIATRLVSEEFKKYVKPKTATISFLGHEEYVLEQKKEEEKIKKRFETYVANIQGYIKRLENNKVESQKFLNDYPSLKAMYQKNLDEYRGRWGNWYSDCKNALGDSTYCTEGKSRIDTTIQIMQNNMSLLDADVAIAQRNIANDAVYKKEAQQQLALAQQNYQEFLKNPVTPELQGGVFNPPDRILIRYYETQPVTFSSYMETVLHEYVHFYSHAVGGEEIETFLNEGITDFLAQRIGEKYMPEESVKVGYVAEVSLINKITQRIPVDELIPVFFNDSNKTFKTLFTDEFKDVKYDDFIAAGKNLFYISPNDRQAKMTSLRQIESMFTESP